MSFTLFVKIHFGIFLFALQTEYFLSNQSHLDMLTFCESNNGIYKLIFPRSLNNPCALPTKFNAFNYLLR